MAEVGKDSTNKKTGLSRFLKARPVSKPETKPEPNKPQPIAYKPDSTPAAKAFSGGRTSKTRSRGASKSLTSSQASIAAKLTGGKSRSSLLNRLPEEDRRAILESKAGAGDNEVSRVQTPAEASAERIQQAETPQEQAQILAQELDSHDGEEAAAILEAAGPEVIEALKEAEPEVVAETLNEFSTLAQDNEDVAQILAEQLAEDPPQNFSGVLEGFASSSASGESDLAHAFAQELEDRGVPASTQIQQAANLDQAVRQINSDLEPGDLASTSAAADLITGAIDGAPPEVARALINELERNGSLETITSTLGESAKDVDRGLQPGETALTDHLAPAEGDLSDRTRFDRTVTALSNAVSVADDERITDLVGGRIADGIGDNIRRFDESFQLAVGQGRGAALAGSVAEALHARGDVSVSAKVVEAIERGADDFLTRFDDTADRVDTANQDLGYLLAQWGPLYGESEEGQAALNERIEEFRTGRSEYEDLNDLSANVGADLEVLRELQSLFPDKDHLKDRELDLLAETTRFGQTPNGQRALAEAAMRSGEGQQSFLDRLMDEDFKNSLSDGELEDLGFENFDDYQMAIGQQTLTGSVALMAEASVRGDDHTREMISHGLMYHHELLGESEQNLSGALEAIDELHGSALDLAGAGGDAVSARLDAAVEELENSLDNFTNPATAAKLRLGGAALGLAGSGLGWYQAAQDGLSAEEAVLSAVPTLEGLLAGGEAIAAHRGGRLLGLTDDALGRGAQVFAGIGLLLDGYSLYQAIESGDPVQAGISAIGAVGSVAAIAGATGVGAAIGVTAAALGLAYGQYQKVKASNRYESEEARAFIRGALEQAGIPEDNIDEVARHLSNADDEGRQIGILIQQAAEQGGIDPQELFRIIGSQSPGTVLDIVEAGHGVDPTGDTLSSLPDEIPELDQHVGTGHFFLNGPHSVEGFLIYLEQRGLIDR